MRTLCCSTKNSFVSIRFALGRFQEPVWNTACHSSQTLSHMLQCAYRQQSNKARRIWENERVFRHSVAAAISLLNLCHHTKLVKRKPLARLLATENEGNRKRRDTWNYNVCASHFYGTYTHTPRIILMIVG